MALYRKYRPATFAEVVGQEHVTEPLCTSLDSGRINHAYLFSGPRGCGKTSSARILARSLNCVQGPTSTPCGVCDSCVALAPGGSGTLDVTELDAATHNGVDDMRELRDRAFYAPAESRYRVFIIDEAHMISQAGFNALLKIVEEPPEHLIFIFATTEPEKLLQTIRSRTHNYPFRLLTPPMMRGLLERICTEEGVLVEDAVYPLVIRAGGGSPRDSLSVMDQLLAGAGPEGVTYPRAVALLGVTDSALLDRTVDALAASDQAGLFSVISDVIDAGHDPRRFTTDLLDRFRDLLVVKSVPEAFDTGLVDAPADQRDVLVRQAGELGTATLTRCAALVNEGLMQMRGATSPRLLLEILCARMALPAAGMTVESLAQRLEALESGQVSPGPVGAGSAGTTLAGAVGASGRGGPSEMDAPRYVRKSQRTAASESAASSQVETPAGAAEVPSVPPAAAPVKVSPVGEVSAGEVPTDSPVDTVPGGVSPEQTTPEHLGTPDEAPDSAESVPAVVDVPASVPQEGSSADDGMTEAELAREIMRRNRRRGRAEARPVSESVSEPARTPEPTSGPTPAAAPMSTPAPMPTPPIASSATEPAPQPVPENQREGMAETTDIPDHSAPEASVGVVGTDTTREDPVSHWAEILEALRGIDLSAWIAARDATPSPGNPGPEGAPVVVLHHHTGALANFINDPAHATAYATAAESVIGIPVMVRAVVGPPGKTEAVGPAVGEPEQPQTPRPNPRPTPRPGTAEDAAVAITKTAEPAPVSPSPDPAAAAETVPPSPDPAVAVETVETVVQASEPEIAAPSPDVVAEATPEQPRQPVSEPTDAVSVALARAKAQESAASSVVSSTATATPAAPPVAPTTAGVGSPGPISTASPRGTAPTEDQPLTGWRARLARHGARGGVETGEAFDGVPLPEEPGEPWDDGGGAAPVGSVENHAPYDEAAEAAEALAQLDDPNAGTLDHRSALDIAGELLETHLGAERTR